MRAVVVVLVLLALTATASACEYVSAWDDRIPSNIPPYEIPMWIRSNFDDLCGYFTEDGYFSTIFELDAFYRWKYPEIYDSRIYDIIYLSDGSVNRTFLEWYWDDQETVRAWLREIWNYPDDWRVIIAVSMKIYYEGGEDIKALDRDVALTPEHESTCSSLPVSFLRCTITSLRTTKSCLAVWDLHRRQKTF